MQSWKLENEYGSMEVLAFGGILNALELTVDGTRISLINGYETEDEAKSLAGYKSAVLVPFPNRLADGQYTLNGKVHQIPINRPQENNAIHGLICDIEAELVEQTETSITVRATLASSQGYPATLIVQTTYTLETGLSVETCVTNASGTAVPVGIGWHHYFTLGCVDDCSLQLPASQRLIVDDRMIPVGDELDERFAKALSLNTTELDDCFVTNGPVILANSAYELCVAGKENISHMQIYTPKDRQSIAIEPMTCPPNAFADQKACILKEGETFSASFTAYVEKVDQQSSERST